MSAVRFCSACGAELPARPPVTCTRCGTSHWLNPKLGAAAVVIESERVLLARRAHDPWKGRWGVPAGFVELGEHPIETAVREALEETGVHIEVTGYLDVWIDEYTDAPGEPDAEIINVAYSTAAPVSIESSSVDPAEVSELAWFGWDELPADLAPQETLADVLQTVRTATPTPILDRQR